MRTLIVFLFLCANGVYAQEWQMYHRNEMGLTYGLTSPDDDSRHFRINSEDNSLWMTTLSRVQTLGTGDVVQVFGLGHPDFQGPFWFSTFGFMSNKVLISNTFKGVYLYENEVVSMIYNGAHSGIAIEGDTLYILRENNSMVKWVDGNTSYLFNTGYARVMSVKDNLFWVSEGFGSTGGMTVYTEDGNYNWYNPVTSLMMDFGNYDFKFSPHNDTLYVAGNKGLSLLHNLVFFDSIAPDNTTDMPAGVILDFEFDADDNIWALFSSNVPTATSVAHYNQATKTWDVYYDATNSNLNFDSYCSIEMDNLGNLWMVNSDYIHVLELNVLPEWLSVKQSEYQLVVSVFPNPVEDVFHIETDVVVSEIYLTDQLGKRIKTLNPNGKQFSISEFPAGVYFVTIIGSDAVGTVKLLKE